MQKDKIVIYTDGACLGNPGPGGYGVVLINNKKRKEYSGGFRKTTNNRMELLAAIVGLSMLGTDKKYDVTIHTDSRLLTDGFNKFWVRSWKRNNWRKSNNDEVLNKELWIELDRLNSIHNVTFEWLKGHSGIPENERCDILSKEAAAMPDLPPDSEYEGIKGKTVIEYIREWNSGLKSKKDRKPLKSVEPLNNILDSEEFAIDNIQYTLTYEELSDNNFLVISQNEGKETNKIKIRKGFITEFHNKLGEFIKTCKKKQY